MDASVLITTRNRRDELRRAVSSALAQTSRPEVIVIDDASTDGTVEMLAHEFPQVRLHRSERAQGYIVQRNRGIGLAGAPIVVSLDDDAVLAPQTVEQTLRDFDDPRVGAVAIPCVDVDPDGTRAGPAASGDRVVVTSEFAGKAFALRREVFLRVGGFREVIFHQGEERDFCIRLLAAGWIVRVGRADPIRHYPSARRDLRRMDVYGRRNSILCAWHNEPFPSALLRMLEMSGKGVGWGLKVGRTRNMLDGLLLGYRACWEERGQRRPVSRGVNRLFRRLWKRGPLLLDEIAPQLPVATSYGDAGTRRPPC